MRKQEFLRLWSEVLGQAQVAERARFTPRKNRPTNQTMTPTTKDLTRQYQHIFRIREGREGPGFGPGDTFSLSSDELGIVEDIAGRLADQMSTSTASGFSQDWVSFDFVYVGSLRRM